LLDQPANWIFHSPGYRLIHAGGSKRGANGIMKAAIPAMGTNLDAWIDHRFGRCKYFIIVDSETLESKAVKNPNVNNTGGAGTQSAQIMADNGVQVVLASNIGPNAYQTLSFTGVKVMTGATGTVREAIQQFNTGHLKVAEGATVPGLFGMEKDSEGN